MRLTGAFKEFVNGQFHKTLNINLMENIIFLIKKSINFFFFHKKFIKILPKPLSLEHLLTFHFS